MTKTTFGDRSSAIPRCLEIALWALLIAFGVAIALGNVLSILDLVALSRPDPGFGYLVYDDALQMHAGHWPYQDPTDGYVGLLYPPLYTAVWAALLPVHMWSGWGPVLLTVSGLALSGMVAVAAYRPVSVPAAKTLRVLEAVAIGMVAWWLVSSNPFLGPTGGNPDPMAWALAIGGLMLLPRSLRGSTPALVGSVLLLSLGFWTKQPAAAASLAAGCWALLSAAFGVTNWRRSIAVIVGLATVNLLVLAALSLATHGWAFFYIFVLGRRHDWIGKSNLWIVRQELPVLGFTAAVAVSVLILGLAARVRTHRTATRQGRRLSWWTRNSSS